MGPFEEHVEVKEGDGLPLVLEEDLLHPALPHPRHHHDRNK